jgi:hypothetical protein
MNAACGPPKPNGTPKRCGDQGQREQVGGDRDQTAARMHGIGQRFVIVDPTEGVGVLQQRAEAIGGHRIRIGADHQLDAHRFGAGAQHFEGLRMHAAGDEEQVRLRFGGTLGQGHRFGGGGALVQQRSVGDFHAGEIGAHGLEVDQRFHPAL